MLYLLLLVISPAQAQGAPAPSRFRLCSMDVDYEPYGNVEGTGQLQYLMQQASRNLGVEVERYVAPRRRCLEQLKAGLVDGMFGAYSAERAEYAVFPMAGAEPDEKKSVATPRYFAYRRKGSPLAWDGQRFSGLGEGRIGVESGFAFIIEQLQRQQVRYDDGAKTLELNLAKLLAGRLEGVIGMEAEAGKLIASRYPDKLERTARPFEQTPLYLMFSRQFHAQYPGFAIRYWQALQDYRGTADYRQYQLSHP
ncbi:hypothetical protein LJR289_003577 [Pseudoduganella sp. LjRoot289]|uniref:substrate-binding periplasmic protein n=1 Tax=Pseudoduganella sp. LjRoot289 TaxID=3342314 RepID=UPI003ED14870